MNVLVRNRADSWLAGLIALICFTLQSPTASAEDCGRLIFNRLQSITNSFKLEWFSVTNGTYEIAAITDITVNASNWVSVASQYAAAPGTNLTSFVDNGATTNKAKFYKVTKTGISIALCQSNSYSGVVDVPLEIGIPSSQKLTGISLIIDGEPNMSIVDPVVSNLNFVVSASWDTTLVSNGWHTIQAFAQYPDSSQDGAGGVSQYSSQIVTAQVFNAISFPDMLQTWGTAIGIRAFLSTTNADWTINVLSPSTNLLRVLSGTTSNGLINVLWDGKDTNGVQFTGAFVRLDITTSTTSGSGFSISSVITNKAGKVVYKEGSMPSFPQGFLVSYQLLFPPSSTGAIAFQNMIDQVALTVEGGGSGPYELRGDGTGTSATTKIDATVSSWNSWILSLKGTTTANLYYFGHGAAKQIGPDPSPYVGLGFTSAFIQQFMGNRYEGGGFFSKGVPIFDVPYHFVFLDGCNTSDGDLCVAFGIERKKVPTNFYTNNGLLPRAFVGWKTVKVYKVGNTFASDHGNFIINLFTDWANTNDPLIDVINRNLPGAFTAPKVWGDDQLRWAP